MDRRPPEFQSLDLNSESHDQDDDTRRRTTAFDLFTDTNRLNRHPIRRSSSDDDRPPGLESHVNTGLQLSTGNSSTNRFMADHPIPTKFEDQITKSKLAFVEAELEKKNMEIFQLGNMVSQLSRECLVLRDCNQQLRQQYESKVAPHEVDSNRKENCYNDKKGKGVIINQGVDKVPQFLEVGPSSKVIENSPLHSSLIHANNVESCDRAREDIRDENMSNPSRSLKVNWNSASPNSNSKGSSRQTAASASSMRKPRVAVRVRCETLADGCHWRKYGQKIAKGSPFPRAYYRCTMNEGCPVRKQVQRCAEDRSVMINTYEGKHNHPLPPTAMAMDATTTSAAAMLLSGSLSSAEAIMNPAACSSFLAATASTSGLLLPAGFPGRMATISASAPFPTITLDLTQHDHRPNNTILQQHFFQGPLPAPPQFHVPFSPTNANNLLPPQLVAAGQAALIYNNQSNFSGLQMSSHELDGGESSSAMSQNNSMAHRINAALASDPNFANALTTAITSLIIGPGSGAHPIGTGAGNINIANEIRSNDNVRSSTDNNSRNDNKSSIDNNSSQPGSN